MTRMWLVVLAACGGGEALPDAIDAPAATLEAYIKASNADMYDRFATSVALSTDGSTLAIGAPMEASAATGIDGDQADNSFVMAGAVYIFVRAGGVWTQQAYLKTGTMTQGWFGSAVALSANGSTLVVSAPNEGFNAEGAVYVFERAGTRWSQAARLAGAGGFFGHSVAVSGDGLTLAVGAYGEDTSGMGRPYVGAVHLFMRGASGWVPASTISGANTEAGDYFAWSVALSGDGTTLAVGAVGEASAATGVGGDATDNSKPRSGAAYVFTRGAAGWQEWEYIKASNTDENDAFGTAVALSGDAIVLAVGAPVESSAAIGIDGDQTNNSAGAAGAVYTFVRTSGSWKQTGYLKGAHVGGPVKLDAGGAGGGDLVGSALALSADGARLAVGAPGDTGEVGAAYLFVNTGRWELGSYVHVAGGDAGDHAGGAVAIGGTTLAIGAVDEASAARGIGGNQTDNSAPDCGAAYVFVTP